MGVASIQVWRQAVVTKSLVSPSAIIGITRMTCDSKCAVGQERWRQLVLSWFDQSGVNTPQRILCQGGLVILSAKYGAAQAVKLAEEAEAWGAERSSESSTSGQDKAPPQPADTSRFTPRCDGVLFFLAPLPFSLL